MHQSLFSTQDKLTVPESSRNGPLNLYAATLAETGRQKAVGGTEPFAFETVMSTPAKLGLFDEARRNGFQVDMEVRKATKAMV